MAFESRNVDKSRQSQSTTSKKPQETNTRNLLASEITGGTNANLSFDGAVGVHWGPKCVGEYSTLIVIMKISNGPLSTCLPYPGTDSSRPCNFLQISSGEWKNLTVIYHPLAGDSTVQSRILLLHGPFTTEDKNIMQARSKNAHRVRPRPPKLGLTSARLGSSHPTIMVGSSPVPIFAITVFQLIG